MKKIKNDLHSKAVALCEGQIVECSGHFIRASVVDESENACLLCNMDSACNIEMCDLCAECDAYARKKHIFQFAYMTNKRAVQ